MKKSKSKSCKRGRVLKDRTVSGATESSTRADMPSVRQKISDVVVKEAMAMVTTTIDQVKEGHFQAMKYLFEMVGLFPATEGESAPRESLAGTLLGRLGLLEDAEAQGRSSDPGEQHRVP